MYRKTRIQILIYKYKNRVLYKYLYMKVFIYFIFDFIKTHSSIIHNARIIARLVGHSVFPVFQKCTIFDWNWKLHPIFSKSNLTYSNIKFEFEFGIYFRFKPRQVVYTIGLIAWTGFVSGDAFTFRLELAAYSLLQYILHITFGLNNTLAAVLAFTKNSNNMEPYLPIVLNL